MKKIALIALLFGAILTPDIFAYSDMTIQADRAADLGMSIQNYTFSMAIAGTLTGFAFNLFLWKMK